MIYLYFSKRFKIIILISLIFLGILTTTLTAYFLTDKTDGNFEQL